MASSYAELGLGRGPIGTGGGLNDVTRGKPGGRGGARRGVCPD